MKKLLLLLIACSGIIFALNDTDSDGVPDETDVCPRVYARSANGCPTLTPSSAPAITNSCLNAQLTLGKMVATITPICDKNSTTCTVVSKVTGFQSCDPIFPIIFDKTGAPMIRGAIYVVDFTK